MPSDNDNPPKWGEQAQKPRTKRKLKGLWGPTKSDKRWVKERERMHKAQTTDSNNK